MDSTRVRAGDREKMESAVAEIEEVLDSLDHIFREYMWPVDKVLAAKVDVARSVLEHVSNDVRDAYVGWEE